MKTLIAFLILLAIAAFARFYYRGMAKRDAAKSTAMAPAKVSNAVPAPPLTIREVPASSECSDTHNALITSWALPVGALDEFRPGHEVNLIGANACVRTGPLAIKLYFCFDDWNSCVYLAPSKETVDVTKVREGPIDAVNFSEISTRSFETPSEQIKDLHKTLQDWGFPKTVFVLTTRSNHPIQLAALTNSPLAGMKFAKIIEPSKINDVLHIGGAVFSLTSDKVLKSKSQLRYVLDKKTSEFWRTYAEFSGHDVFEFGSLANHKQKPIIVEQTSAGLPVAELRALYTLYKNGFTELYLLANSKTDNKK